MMRKGLLFVLMCVLTLSLACTRNSSSSDSTSGGVTRSAGGVQIAVTSVVEGTIYESRNVVWMAVVFKNIGSSTAYNLTVKAKAVRGPDVRAIYTVPSVSDFLVDGNLSPAEPVSLDIVFDAATAVGTFAKLETHDDYDYIEYEFTWQEEYEDSVRTFSAAFVE